MSKEIIRGIDHIGITVPDIEEATRFFESAFSAELIYDSVAPSDEDVKGQEAENMLNLFPGTVIKAVRMMKLRHGPGLELFEMKGPEQNQPSRPSDFGIQHFAVHVDNIHEAMKMFEDAGGKMYTSPQPIMFAAEAAENNFFCYGQTPWGTVIELISLPSPLPYEKGTVLRRWKPQQ
ncbi:VOC family protein (plasmid) [Pseudomonas luteola]|uniref:VOC family protein n=1 Tax=Pseudomonas luteola TaxID=47886 RepID=UPI00388DCDF1